MRCDALGAERPLETTSETVILPPPASGNTAVQKRARKCPLAMRRVPSLRRAQQVDILDAPDTPFRWGHGTKMPVLLSGIQTVPVAALARVAFCP